MTLELSTGTGTEAGTVRVRAVFSGAQPVSGELERADELAWHGFSGALGETLRRDFDTPELLVGLGDADRLSAETLRRAGAAIARAGSHVERLYFEPSGLSLNGLDAKTVARSLGEGALLAAYRFDAYKTESKESSLTRLELGDDPATAAGVHEAIAIAEGVTLARDLINTPPSDLTPVRFAERAAGVATATGLGIEIYDEIEIERERLGGILAVARGSQQPPRLVRLVYEPDGTSANSPTVYFVGKGITFDSGGLAIKPITGMMTMKTDMSGAAAVLGAMSTLGRLGIDTRVVGLAPLTENMSGGNAVKPGDVLRARNGKTIEVLNPDAEGRLVLADALSLAVEGGADLIVDIATLTGAIGQALGGRIAGLMGNDERAITLVHEASARAGEPTWELPLPAGYHSHIESEIADMKNMGNGSAGAIAAALLLEEFVADVPWAHLDIAGAARSTEDSGYLQKGATGFGVRTLIELVRDYVPLGGRAEVVPEGRTVFQ